MPRVEALFGLPEPCSKALPWLEYAVRLVVVLAGSWVSLVVAGCMGGCRAACPVAAQQYEPAVLASCVVNFMLAARSTCIPSSGVFGSLHWLAVAE